MDIEACFVYINRNWNIKDFTECKKEWENVQKYIVTEEGVKSIVECSSCKTKWCHSEFMYKGYKVCPNCDTFCQPYLCNPINKKYIEKYIDPKYHEHIFQNTS